MISVSCKGMSNVMKLGVHTDRPSEQPAGQVTQTALVYITKISSGTEYINFRVYIYISEKNGHKSTLNFLYSPSWVLE